MNGKTVFLLVGIMLFTGMYTSTVKAQYDLCLQGDWSTSIWELKVIVPGPGGDDFGIEIDRTNFTPIPSSGGWSRVNASAWDFNWSGSFSGTTQGTVTHSCEINPSGALPWTGTGMRQRNASFTGGTAEFVTGICTLDVCSNFATVSGEDKDTQP